MSNNKPMSLVTKHVKHPVKKIHTLSPVEVTAKGVLAAACPLSQTNAAPSMDCTDVGEARFCPALLVEPPCI